VCILKIFPDALDAQISDTGKSGNIASLAEPWFCPCHICVGCHSVNIPPSTLSVKEVPLLLHEHQRLAVAAHHGHHQADWVPGAHASDLPASSFGTEVNSNNNSNSSSSSGRERASRRISSGSGDSSSRDRRNEAAAANESRSGGGGGGGGGTGDSRNGIRLKTVRGCQSCPFAMCRDCEVALAGQGGSLFQSRRFSDVRFFTFTSCFVVLVTIFLFLIYSAG
jgi:hypothetical protein